MNEENGYAVPDSQPNLRSINPYASRPEDPEYVYPDACSRNNKFENVMGVSKPVVELQKDKYGYITLQEDSALPSGVYSSIVDTRSNLPGGPGADVCDDLKVTTSKEEIDFSWKRRFYISLVIYVFVVSGLLIPLIYLIVPIDQNNIAVMSNMTDKVAIMIDRNWNKKGFTLVRCNACLYKFAKSSCNEHGLNVARFRDLEKLGIIAQKCFEQSSLQLSQLIWTKLNTVELRKIYTQSHSSTTLLSDKSTYTPYIFEVDHPQYGHIYDINDGRVQARVHGVLCQDRG